MDNLSITFGKKKKKKGKNEGKVDVFDFEVSDC